MYNERKSFILDLKGTGERMDCKRAQSMVTPYIQKKLNDKEMEEFLEHISHCGECYEELEIYFTAYYTLERLEEEDGEQVYDVEHALHENLAESRFYIWKRKISRIYHMGILALAEIMLLIVFLSQIHVWHTGSMDGNPIYRMIVWEKNIERAEGIKK